MIIIHLEIHFVAIILLAAAAFYWNSLSSCYAWILFALLALVEWFIISDFQALCLEVGSFWLSFLSGNFWILHSVFSYTSLRVDSHQP